MYLSTSITPSDQKKSNFISLFGFKNVIIKNSGTDTVADIEFIAVDTNNNSKIYNNESAKKYLKIKIFEINNDIMFQKINSINDVLTLEDLNNLIISNGCVYKDISAANYSNVNIFQNTNYINLMYKTSLIFKEEEKKYLQLGIVFYFDLFQYIAETKIPLYLLDKSTIISSVRVDNILTDSGEAWNTNIVKKINKTKKIFSDNNRLNKITNFIALIDKNIKFLSEKKVNLTVNDNFFSDLYPSRDKNGNLNFLFFLDYEKLISKYSSFGDLNFYFRNGNFNEISKINSVKIVKRQIFVNEKINKKPLLKDSKIYEVVTTNSATNENYLINESDINTGFIREIKGLNYDKVAFEVIDKEIYLSKNKNYYQYGVEIEFQDNFYNYVKNLLNGLRSDIKIFNTYLEMTNISYFNKQLNIFNNSFEDVFNTRLKPDIIKCLYNLIFLLKTLNVIKTQDDVTEKELENTITSLLMPQAATPQNIVYSHQVFDKVINFTEKLLENKFASKNKVEHWFSNNYINSDEDYRVGYSFFDRDLQENNSGLLKISNIDLEKRISDQIFDYTVDSEVDQSIKYAYLAPYKIDTRNINSSILTNLLSIDDQQFIDINTDIKLTNLLPTTISSTKIVKGSNIINTPTDMDIVLKSNSMLNYFSCMTDNLFVDNNDETKKGKFGTTKELEFKNNVDPTFLYIGLLKGVFKGDEDKILNNNDKIINKPFHIKALNENRDKYFTLKVNPVKIDSNNPGVRESGQIKYLASKNRDYLKSLGSMSRYLLLYNTIHSIEVLFTINNDIKNNIWTLLTTDIYNRLDENKKYLCRLNLYSDSNIKNFKEVELPIYDKYFILEKNVNENELNNQLREYSKLYDNYVDQKTEIAFYNSQNNSYITTESGLTPNFEEDLSDKDLIKEYVKVVAFGSFYKNNVFSAQRIIDEVTKRAGGRENIDAKFLIRPWQPLPFTADTPYLTNSMYLMYKFTDNDIIKLYNDLENETKIKLQRNPLSLLSTYNWSTTVPSTEKGIVYLSYDKGMAENFSNSKIINKTFTRYEIYNDLLRRFGINWNDRINKIQSDERNRILEERRRAAIDRENERIADLAERDRKRQERLDEIARENERKRIEAENERKRLLMIERRRSNLKITDQIYFPYTFKLTQYRNINNSFNPDKEEYLNYILMSNSGSKFYYPPYSCDIYEMLPGLVSDKYKSLFGDWKTREFWAKHMFNMTLSFFINSRKELYEDLISFRKEYYESEVKRRAPEIAERRRRNQEEINKIKQKEKEDAEKAKKGIDRQIVRDYNIPNSSQQSTYNSDLINRFRESTPSPASSSGKKPGIGTETSGPNVKL